MFNRLAERHLQQFLQLRDRGGKDIQVRQPAARSATGTSPAAKALGKRETVEAIGSVATIRVVISGSVSAGDHGETQTFPVGTLHEADLVLRAYLPDVLEDPTRPLGRTLLDTAKDIIIDGERFEVIGKMPRTGLPPLGPYIVWVAVKRSGEAV